MCDCNITKSILDCYEHEDAQQEPLSCKLLRGGPRRGPMQYAMVRDLHYRQGLGKPGLQKSEAVHTSCLLLRISTHLIKDIYRSKKNVPFMFALILEKFENENERHRRIGLAILQETTDSSTAWLEKTMKIP